jgi:hypothetical protein
MTTVLLVDKVGTIKPLKIKEYNEEDFYKKCGYKSSSNFQKQHTWKVRVNGTNYWISLFAKSDVKGSLGENKYEFPPPVDSVLYFGTCLLAGYTNGTEPFSLSVELWDTIYNKLYGGFENLADTAEKDEQEPDELEHIPDHKKTKEGYLKDGFVVETKNKKVSGTSSSKSKKSSQSTTTSAGTNKKVGGGGGGGGGVGSSAISGPISSSYDEDNTSEDADDESTIYTDIDDDEDDEDEPVKSSGIKKKETSGTSAKKKGTTKEDSNPIELNVNELLITDELKEEPYIE